MGAFSFPKSHRLRRRHEFLHLGRRGARAQNAFVIAVHLEKTAAPSRLGITVTRKVGNACVRNRLKRFTREYFRLNGRRLHRPYDINIIFKKRAARIGSREAFKALEDIFGRISKDFAL